MLQMFFRGHPPSLSPHHYTHQTSKHCLFVSQTLTSNGSNSPEIGCDSAGLLEQSQENQFSLLVLRGKVPCFSFSMQSEKTCSRKQLWVRNRCRRHQKVIITILVFYVIFLCFLVLFIFLGGIIFHGMKSQLGKTQIGLLHTKTRANGKTEAEGTERGKWNNIICAVMVIICCRRKWLRPVEKGWWLSLCWAGCFSTAAR